MRIGMRLGAIFEDQILELNLRSFPLTPALSPKGARGKGADRGPFKT